MTTSIYEQIEQQLIALNRHPDFVVANPIQQLAETLAEGYAVDSIFYESPEGASLTELRVWFKDGALVTTAGPMFQWS